MIVAAALLLGLGATAQDKVVKTTDEAKQKIEKVATDAVDAKDAATDEVEAIDERALESTRKDVPAKEDAIRKDEKAKMTGDKDDLNDDD